MIAVERVLRPELFQSVTIADLEPGWETGWGGGDRHVVNPRTYPLFVGGGRRGRGGRGQ